MKLLLPFVFIELKYKWIIMNEKKYKWEPRLYFRYLQVRAIIHKSESRSCREGNRGCGFYSYLGSRDPSKVIWLCTQYTGTVPVFVKSHFYMEIGQFRVLFWGEAEGQVQLKDHMWPLFQQTPKGLKKLPAFSLWICPRRSLTHKNLQSSSAEAKCKL